MKPLDFSMFEPVERGCSQIPAAPRLATPKGEHPPKQQQGPLRASGFLF